MYEQTITQQQDEWEELTSGGEGGGYKDRQAWLPNEGDEIVGIYVDVYRIKKGTKKEKNVYVLQDKKGEEWSVFGGAVLDNEFKKCTFGDKVKIEYLGERESKDFTYRAYRLFRSKLHKAEKEELVLE